MRGAANRPRREVWPEPRRRPAAACRGRGLWPGSSSAWPRGRGRAGQRRAGRARPAQPARVQQRAAHCPCPGLLRWGERRVGGVGWGGLAGQSTRLVVAFGVSYQASGWHSPWQQPRPPCGWHPQALWVLALTISCPVPSGQRMKGLVGREGFGQPQNGQSVCWQYPADHGTDLDRAGSGGGAGVHGCKAARPQHPSAPCTKQGPNCCERQFARLADLQDLGAVRESASKVDGVPCRRSCVQAPHRACRRLQVAVCAAALGFSFPSTAQAAHSAGSCNAGMCSAQTHLPDSRESGGTPYCDMGSLHPHHRPRGPDLQHHGSSTRRKKFRATRWRWWTPGGGLPAPDNPLTSRLPRLCCCCGALLCEPARGAP